MLQLYAKAENLSCLINTDSSIELIPEPFRMQPDVLFKVTYSEYVNFVLSLSLDSQVKLMTPTDVLLNMARTKQPKLYNCFLSDMAFAMLKEIMFAEHYREKATVIVPASYNRQNVGITDMLKMSPQCVSAQTDIIKRMKAMGYAYPKEVSAKNSDLFRMAIVLYHIALSDRPVEEINVVYDLPQ